MLTDGREKLIGLDVFDTLLSKPLLDPEFTKKIVARRSSAEAGQMFLRFLRRSRGPGTRTQRRGRRLGRDLCLGELTHLGG